MFDRLASFAILVLITGSTLVTAKSASAQASTTANVVYGQSGSFTASGANDGGINANSALAPYGVVSDSSGNLYMADTSNMRVLFYPSGSTIAARVYGQFGSFTTNTSNNGGVSANSLFDPYSVALDSSGNLYVADSGNNRVLFYPSGGTTATRVYGQLGSFTTNIANNGGISANSLNQPEGLALDSSGNLYVGDYANNRVLFYPSGSTTATRVYGQGGSFTTNTQNKGGISANSLLEAEGVALDSSGNLYVADYGNSRVLFYLSGSTTATRVYGQVGSFTTNTENNGGISANSLDDPTELALDSSGNLYVVDNRNHRVLFYTFGSTTATQVYGQFGSFTTAVPDNGGVSANSLYYPWGVALDPSGNLYVADGGNNRVLAYPPTTPGIYNPVNHSTLPGSSVTFWWGAYPGATAYWLDLSSAPGGNNYYQSGSLSASTLSLTVSSLPTDGSTVYATWYYQLNGNWVPTGYSYTAFGGGSTKGIITSPTPGSTLSGSSVAFTWSAGIGATAYWIDAGSTAGGNQYYQSGNLGNALAATVNSLPTNGSTVYVTLYSLVNGQWVNNQYTYTAYNVSNSQGVLTTPAPGSMFSGSSVTFSWTAGSGASAYWLDIGNIPGGNQYYQSGNLGNVLTTRVNNLPINGSTVYATLYSLVGGQWLPNAYTYTAFNQSAHLAIMQSPLPGSTIAGTQATFYWNPGTGATSYWLDIGSTLGGNNYYQSGNLGNVLNTTVNTLPANGSQIYATLYSYIGGQWLNNQYTYTSGPMRTSSVIMSLVIDRSGSEASDGGAGALQAAVPQFLQDFTQGLDYIALVSFASTSSTDVPITTQFVTPIDTAISSMTFAGGTFGTGAGTNPNYSTTYGPPLSMADYQNNTIQSPPGHSSSKAVVYFTDGLMNTIQDQFSCNNSLPNNGLYNYGGYDSGTLFDFFDPPNNTQSTNDISYYYSGTASGNGGCTSIEGQGLCQGNPPWSATARCLGVTTFYSQQHSTNEVFSRANITAEAQWRAIYTANQMRSETPIPTYVYVIGLGSAVAGSQCTEAFLSTLANDPNGPSNYTCSGSPAIYNPSLPAGLFLAVPDCPSSQCTAELNVLFQTIASRLIN